MQKLFSFSKNQIQLKWFLFGFGVCFYWTRRHTNTARCDRSTVRQLCYSVFIMTIHRLIYSSCLSLKDPRDFSYRLLFVVTIFLTPTPPQSKKKKLQLLLYNINDTLKCFKDNFQFVNNAISSYFKGFKTVNSICLRCHRRIMLLN